MSKLRAPQIDTGDGANQIVELDGSGNLPAVDGSAVSNVNATELNGVTAGNGANQIVTRDGSSNNDADTLGGQPVGTAANDIVALDGSAKLPAVDGSQLTGVVADTGLLLASKTADETVTNSTVFQDDDELSVIIPGPGFYIINLFMVSDGPAAGVGLDFQFDYADTISSSVLSISSDGSTGGTGINSPYTNQTVGVGTFSGNLWVGSATFLNSGLLKLQWAQNTADATGTTLFAGSYLSVKKV